MFLKFLSGFVDSAAAIAIILWFILHLDVIWAAPVAIGVIALINIGRQLEKQRE